MASDVRLKEQLPELTKRIVETYTSVGKINHLGHVPLPNYEAVIDIVDDLREILYPGYRRREGLHLANVAFHVGDLIDRLHDKLTTQIARALRHESIRKGELPAGVALDVACSVWTPDRIGRSAISKSLASARRPEARSGSASGML